MQFAQPLDFAFGLQHGGACGCHTAFRGEDGGVGLLKLGQHRLRVDAHQHLPLLHCRPFLYGQIDNLPAHLRGNHHLRFRLNHSRRGHRFGNGSGRCLFGLHQQSFPVVAAANKHEEDNGDQSAQDEKQNQAALAFPALRLNLLCHC